MTGNVRHFPRPEKNKSNGWDLYIIVDLKAIDVIIKLVCISFVRFAQQRTAGLLFWEFTTFSHRQVPLKGKQIDQFVQAHCTFWGTYQSVHFWYIAVPNKMPGAVLLFKAITQF